MYICDECYSKYFDYIQGMICYYGQEDRDCFSWEKPSVTNSYVSNEPIFEFCQLCHNYEDKIGDISFNRNDLFILQMIRKIKCLEERVRINE